MDTTKTIEGYVYTISHSGILQEEGDAANFQLEGEREKEQSKGRRNCLTRIRRSPNTATMVLFTVVFLDGMLLTSLGIYLNFVVQITQIKVQIGIRFLLEANGWVVIGNCKFY